MTQNSPPTPGYSGGRTAIGAVIGLATHAVVFLVAYLTFRLRSGGAGGGMEDLGAIAAALLIGEAVVGLACIVIGGILFARNRRDTGLGLVAGWIIGLAGLCLYSRFGG